MDSRMLALLSNKPELITSFPRWMFSEAMEKELKETEGLAIGEIAGRDSMAAVLEAVRIRNITALLPTIAYTGTEFGDWNIPFDKVELLTADLAKRGIRVFNPLVLGAPRWWRRLCGRSLPSLFKRFGFYSPCLGCHLYLHSLRIPLARKIDCKVIIAGERESHQGTIKVNQIAVALDAYTSLTRAFGIELFLPVRRISKTEDITAVIKGHGVEGDEQLGCVLSRNYLDEAGTVTCPEDAIERFFSEFAIREAEDLIKGVLPEL